MNHVYQQKGGTCSGFAVANAIEAQLGITLSDNIIYDYYDKHDMGPEGIRLLELCNLMKHREPMGGIGVESIRIPYSFHRGNNVAYEIRKYLANPDYELIASVGIRDSEEILPLDDDFYLQPNKGKIVSAHAMHIPSLNRIHPDKRQFDGIVVENSWGHQWGDNGKMYVKWPDVWSEILTILAVKFYEVH